MNIPYLKWQRRKKIVGFTTVKCLEARRTEIFFYPQALKSFQCFFIIILKKNVALLQAPYAMKKKRFISAKFSPLSVSGTLKNFICIFQKKIRPPLAVLVLIGLPFSRSSLPSSLANLFSFLLKAL